MIYSQVNIFDRILLLFVVSYTPKVLLNIIPYSEVHMFDRILLIFVAAQRIILQLFNFINVMLCIMRCHNYDSKPSFIVQLYPQHIHHHTHTFCHLSMHPL